MTKKTMKRKHPQRQQRNGAARHQQNLLPMALAGGILLLIVAGLLILLRQPDNKQAEVPITASGSPKLVIDQEQIDFGDVPLNKMVKASFTLSNSGDQPLIISNSPVAEVVEGC